jgi:hypothetical protein
MMKINPRSLYSVAADIPSRPNPGPLRLDLVQLACEEQRMFMA